MKPETSEQVNVELGQQVVVTLASPEIRHWGPYQFPGLARLPDGRIQVSFHVEADSATAYGLPPARAVSADEGRTWELLPREHAADDPEGSVPLPNGDRLKARHLTSLPIADLVLPTTPFGEYTSYGTKHMVYRVEDVPAAAAEGWKLQRLAAGATHWVEEQASVRLPGEVRVACDGVMWRPWLFPQFAVAPDGSLLAVNYTLRRIVDGRFQEACPITILRSTDAGRSWELWSETPYAGDPVADPQASEREGFTEPYLHFLPDGSALCLLRTTDGSGVGPLYGMRSTDNGRTWTQSTVFDDLGVLPQMLTLKNGITLAAYGRPGLYVRATADRSGLQWNPRVAVVEPGRFGWFDTCAYAALLPLGDDTALLAYSNFNVPDSAGRPCKAICVRTVKAAKADCGENGRA